MQNIIQWNCNGCTSHINELRIMLREHDPFCVALQETHFKPGHNFSLRGFNIFRKDVIPDRRARGGVALLLKHNVIALEVNLNTCLQAVAVRIESPIIATLCSLYLPDGTWHVDQLHNLITLLPPPIILMGDFNAHSPLWGSIRRDIRGRTIEEFIVSSNLVLINTGAPTRFDVRTAGCSAIDLSMCSPQLATRITWTTLEDLNFSDHFPIVITTDVAKNFHPSHKRWLTEKADWNKFSGSVSDLMLPEDVNAAVDLITEAIKGAAKDSIPMTSGTTSNKAVPWWNETIQDAIRKKKSALNAFKRRPTTINMIEFKKLRANARKLINEAQKRSWESYVSSITSETPIREMWRKINIISGRKQFRYPSALKLPGSVIEDTPGICNALADQFERASSTANYEEAFQRVKLTSEEEGLDFHSSVSLSYNSPFSYEEFEFALENSKDSAPGLDTVPYYYKRLLIR
nr:unnamed protein product [Callosobruchus chinensis]